MRWCNAIERWRAWLLALSSLGAGCSPGDVPGGHPAERTDSAGVQIVSYGRLSDTERIEVNYDVLVGYDVADEAEASGFVQVADVALLRGGELAVLDRGRAEVLVFSRTGDLMAVAGGPGAGPGELSGGTSLAVVGLPDGSFAVPDIGNGSVSRYSTSGVFLDARRFPDLVVPQWRDIGPQVAVLIGNVGQRIEVMDSLLGPRRVLASTAQDAPDQLDEGWPLLPDHLVWDASRDGAVATARLSQPEVQLYRDGVMERVIRWETPSRHLSAAQTDTLLAIPARLLGDPTGDPETARSRMMIPDEGHALASVMIGGDYILVQNPRPVGGMDERIMSTFAARGWGGGHWMMFRTDGEYMGVVDFGLMVEVFRFDGEVAVGIREVGLGRVEPFVARLQPSDPTN